MQYILLIYDEEAQWARMSDSERKALMDGYRAFTEEIVKSGHFKAGDALEATSKATSVRVRDGKTVRSQGPFAETREQLGGYYVIEAKDADEAAAIAARIPSAAFGTIEVRPILSMSAAMG